jgi:sugar phosphate isomerase/epimerase
MPLRLAIQDNLLPAPSMERKFEQAANWGFDAIEVRGDTLREEHRAIAQQVRQGAGRVAGIVGGYRGWPIAADPDERLQCLEDIARLLTPAAEVEATGVLVVPIYGYSARLPYPQQRDAVADEERLNESLHELTEFAESVGSLLLLEPLNRYETHLIHRLDQGIEWCERIGSERMRLLADLFHMNIEERDPFAALHAARQYLGYVHLADNTRLEPGTGIIDFMAAFRELREIEFDGWCAIECRLSGRPDDVLPRSAAYLRSLWGED